MLFVIFLVPVSLWCNEGVHGIIKKGFWRSSVRKLVSLSGDFCVSQLLSIVHNINSPFDCDPTQDVGGIFSDISKVFNKVWHKGLLYNLETYGAKREVSNLLRNYLRELYQRAALNGQTSSWELIKFGVPQGSVLGPLMFLIYINNLPNNIQSTCKMCAYETSLFSHVSDRSTSQSELNKGFQTISNRVSRRKMQFNPDPSKQAQEVYFPRKANNVSSHHVKFNNTKVVTFPSQKHLELVLDQQLNLHGHI